MKRAANYIPTLLALTAIGFVCLMPSGRLYIPAKIATIPHLDKYLHAFMFAVLSYCAYCDSCRDERRRRFSFLLAFILPTAYGGLIEIIQSLGGIRTGDWIDWLADVAGVTIMLLAIMLVRHNK